MRSMLFAFLGVVLGVTIFVGATIAANDQHTRHEVTIESTASTSYTAAQVALTRANHDRAFLYAVCFALKRRDEISAWETRALAAIERPKSDHTDAAYHAERAKILAEAERQQEDVLHLNCLRMMERHVRDATTVGIPRAQAIP